MGVGAPGFVVYARLIMRRLGFVVHARTPYNASATFNYNTLLIKLKVMAITAQYAMPCANVMPNDDFGPEIDRGRDAAPGNGRAPSARPRGHHLSVSGQWAGVPERVLGPSTPKYGRSGP